MLAPLALALWATTPSLGAQEAPVESPLHVRFAGPRECPEEGLLEFTRGLLKEHRHAEVHVDAEVSRRSTNVYDLSLRLHGSVEGERRLAAGSCVEALRAGAVVIALAVNPQALTEREDVQATGESKETDTSASAVEAPSASTPNSEPPKASVVSSEDAVTVTDEISQAPTSFRLGASARLVYGLAPEPRAGAQLSFGYASGALLARLQAFYDLATTTRHALAGEVRLTSYGAGAELCARLVESGPFESALCGGWQLTAVSAEAPELTRASRRRATISAAVLGVNVDWKLYENAVVLLTAGAAIPTTRPRFVFEVGSGETIAVSQVRPGAVFALGVEWRL